MALVDYSDSDESDSEQPQHLPQASQSKPTAKTNAPPSSIRFAVDKTNPRKIRINLQETEPQQALQRDADGEPAAKRVRTGGGAFSGFSALLPPPKRDAEHTKAPPGRATRKVFSLKTGAELDSAESPTPSYETCLQKNIRAGKKQCKPGIFPQRHRPRVLQRPGMQ